jgi:hypothetical protein
VADEAVAENNAQRLRVSVRADKLNVLVVDEEPRWEYRYLTNYLERDARVKLQKVLFQPAAVVGVDRPEPRMASPANDATEAQFLPDTPAAWAAFDLIVLGDVPPERLGETQQASLAKAVTDRGAALVVIAGPLNMPARYAEARAVRDLLPVEPASAWASQELADHLKTGFRPTIAPDGVTSILSQFTMDESLNAGLWSKLPAWFWHAGQTRAKPAASLVWAIGEPSANGPAPRVSHADARRRALLATMPVGLGRVMYLASDSTWRLRQVNGENLHERFWGQAVRWAVGDDLPAGGRLVKFGTDKPRYVAGEPVTVTARLLGKDLAPLGGKTVKVLARGGDGKPLSETPMTELPAIPGYYKATLGALPAGRVELTLAGPEVEANLAADPTAVAKSLPVDVLPHRDDERLNINADLPTLSRIAEAGAGVAVAGPQAAPLARHLPRLNDPQEVIEQAGLFSDPRDRATRLTHWVFLALFIGLLTAEWVIRKAAGLV